MHVVVLTKSTLDTAAKVEVDRQRPRSAGACPTGHQPVGRIRSDRGGAAQGAHQRQDDGSERRAGASQRCAQQGLAIGIDEAARIWDDGMEGQDSLGYANAVEPLSKSSATST